MRSAELRQERAKLAKENSELVDRAMKSDLKRMTPEQTAEFDKRDADIEELGKQIEKIERLERLEKELVESRIAAREAGDVPGRSRDEAENQKLEMDAFRAYLRGGWAGLTDEQRAFALQRRPALDAAMKDIPADKRAQTVTTSGGGYLIARAFQNELDKAMKAWGPMLDSAVVRVVETSTGANLDWPTVNDTSNTGRLLGINTQATTTDVAFGSTVFGAYKFSSDAVLVPVELAQDSEFPLDSLLAELLGERLGRGINGYLTTGTGSSQPTGIVAAAADSTADFDISDMTATATANTWYPALITLIHSIDPAYRNGAAFMCHDSFVRDIRKMRDTTGQPIWQPSLVAGAPDLIAGYPYYINQSMADTGTNTNKCVLFGQLKKYVTRVVRPMVLLRLTERYADYHQIGYLAFERVDGNLINAGTNPVKYGEAVS